MSVHRIPSIHLLQESVIEKIAAGEVIERPASVVKELVENALDAGATRVDIVIEDAGFSLIKVVDNGCGMGQEDITRCLQRHATSKITTADDLFAVATMGFRGEALASIAAVSRVTVASSTGDTGLGYAISVEGGTPADSTPANHTQGTTVTCRDLFFNVPARKKFMKSRRAERMAISRLLEQMVIAFPAIHYTFFAEGKRTFDLPQVDTPAMRIAQVCGTAFAKKLLHGSGETADISVDVYISDPKDATPRPRYQNLYVNLRRVNNDSVTYAVREAFSRFITSHLKPSWFCFITVDPSRIDVNVHPTKQTIKFEDEKALFSVVFKTVHSSLERTLDINDKIEYTARKPRTAQYPTPTLHVREAVSETTTSGNHRGREESQQIALSFISLFEDKEIIEKEIAHQHDTSVKLTDRPWNLIPCYQIHKMYILAPIKKGIVIIDQHAAHERILYEEALEDMKRGKSESQRLLFPVIFSLSSLDKEVVLASRDYFTMLGFDVQDFGGSTIAVSSMPATGFMKSSTIEEAVREIVHNLKEEKDKELLSAPEKRFAASFACGAAIKFGHALKQEEMNLLLNSLFATKNPYICPHGRPTVVRISIEELSRRFLR